MAGEVTKFWIVFDPMKIDGSYSHYWEDPAIHDEEHRLAQICGALPENGYDIDTLVNVYLGSKRWRNEHAKVYVDETSARKDAEARMAKAKKIYEHSKQASMTYSYDYR